MTNKAEAILVDSREPAWVQNLAFEGAPVSVTLLAQGDVQVATSDGCILYIERKTPDDFLNSLHDDRLLPQIARLAEIRLNEQLFKNSITSWPYLVITGELGRGAGNKVVTAERTTNWDWNAIQGVLATIQEAGVPVVYCAGDVAFEACVLRLAARGRGPLQLLPPRPPSIVGAGAQFLASLPGIGVERALELLKWGGNKPAHVLSAITDPEMAVPGVGKVGREKIRAMLGLGRGNGWPARR